MCLAATLLFAAQASAGTLFACVNKNGSAHLFSKKPKCKKHESKLSWNTQGIAGGSGKEGAAGKNGGNGTNGTNGTNGLDGAVAGFGAFETGELNITEDFEPTAIPGLSKKLPAGSFLASASVNITALSKNAGEDATAACELIDAPETGTKTEVEGKWTSATTTVIIFIFEVHPAQSVIALHSFFTTETPSTLSVRCNEQGHGEHVEEKAINGSLIAVQTKANS